MPEWIPTEEWKGEDAYVIGGGPSLATFDWDLIRGENTVGCNSAFLLGSSICKIVVFGDRLWWEKIAADRIGEYGGRVVACTPNNRHISPRPSWLLEIDRHGRREFGRNRPVFAGNTGSLALNLALILGARRVFLLGFDMHLGEAGNANWHELRYEESKPDVYPRFVKEFRAIAGSLNTVFPGREVWNVSERSGLDCFPIVGVEEHFKLCART